MDFSQADGSIIERQEFELQALQAIYLDDVKDLRTTPQEVNFAFKTDNSEVRVMYE
jgi:hypothetical protein